MPIAKKPWIEQFLPFFANPFFIGRVVRYGPFINPTLRPLSGCIGADKALILNAFPASVRGEVLVFDASSIPTVHQLSFPYYIKPAIGERSVNVYRIETEADFMVLKNANLFASGVWIAQEAFTGTEFGVSVVRTPETGLLTIVFLTEKCVTGNAHTASIANGATFRELLHTADSLLIQSFTEKLEALFASTPLLADFHAGRFDLKARDLTALLSGEFKLIELNGIGGLPLAYFGDDPYTQWNSYFLTLLAIGKKNSKRFSFFARLGRIFSDIPRVAFFVFKQKHFRAYWRLSRR